MPEHAAVVVPAPGRKRGRGAGDAAASAAADADAAAFDGFFQADTPTSASDTAVMLMSLEVTLFRWANATLERAAAAGLAPRDAAQPGARIAAALPDEQRLAMARAAPALDGGHVTRDPIDDLCDGTIYSNLVRQVQTKTTGMPNKKNPPGLL